jgi:hypothetical protein
VDARVIEQQARYVQALASLRAKHGGLSAAFEKERIALKEQMFAGPPEGFGAKTR